LKVLYFSPGLNPHDRRFLTALAITSHEVHFLHENRLLFEGLPGKVTQHHLVTADEVSPVTLVKNYRRILEEVHPDVVHAGPLHDSAWIAAQAHTPHLVSMSWAADILYWFERQQETRKRIFETLDKTVILVADCEAVAQKAIALGFPRERMSLFPWGVDLQHFSPAPADRTNLPADWQDAFILFSNRSFEPIYGVDVLVKAFLKAVKQAPQLRLLLFGKGSLESELRAMVESSGLKEKVIFGGFANLEELPGLYRRADAFVTTSHCDGSSVSLMEALACGKPVIASDIPGNLEWVTDNMNGWVFEDGNVEQLARTLEIASQSTVLENMSANARTLAEKRADWSVNFPILLSGYDKALQFGDGK
jgi:glycosyltransferase involved in cell wall biosynthesis